MPPKQPDPTQQLVENQQLILAQMAELTKAFERNEALFTTLIKGFTPAQASAAATATELTNREKAIAIAVATLAAQGIHILPRQWLALVARFSPKSGAFRTAMAGLIKRKWILKTPEGPVRATDALQAAPEPTPVGWSELMKRFAKYFPPAETDIMHQLMIQAHDFPENEYLDRKTLAERVKVATPDSSSFRARLTALEKAGFIEYGPGDSTVRANLHWFRKG